MSLWSQITPDEISGLKLWLKANEGVVLNGSYVSQWLDASGENNHAGSAFDVIRPTLFPNAINGLPAIRFDGVEDFLEFPLIEDVRTVFWVLKENELAGNSPPRPLLGWSGGFNFLRGDQRQFWNGQFASPSVINGTTRLNFSTINGSTQTVPNQFSIVTLRTTGPVQATHLTMELNIYGRTWWGDMAEVIIYNNPLSDAQIQAVENYLANKYAPAPVPMEDVIISYGFCPTTICAPEGFTSYQWYGGPSSACREVTESGAYSLQMTDVFGRIFYDTLQVVYPGNTGISNAIICEGDSFLWDLDLNSTNYLIELNGQPTDPFITLNTAGDYSLTISDENNCLLERTFQIEVDTFPLQPLLGNDTTLCAGNSIAPIVNISALASLVWNSGSNSTELSINYSGIYWVEAINLNSCLSRDSIEIIIAGTAPVISFGYTTLCIDAPTEFHANAENNDAITQWHWIFNGIDNAFGEQVVYTFNSTGNKTVQLIATAESGCGSAISQSVFVHPAPSVSFSYSNACEGSPVQFTDNSTITPGFIASVQWFINGQLYDVANPAITFTSAGFKSIIHTATSQQGCTAEINSLIEVKAAPQVSWNALPTCLGSLSYFNPIINSPGANITFYTWNFGDGTTSNLANPNHFYPLPGVYSVQLTATNQFGCTGSYQNEHSVLSLPTPDFLVSNACIEQPYILQDLSTSATTDPITHWSWSGSGSFSSQMQNPVISFTNLGLNTINLMVTTQNGCSAGRQKQIPVWPVPVASFTHDPLIGEAPLMVNFTNNSVDANTAQWYFGDTYSSHEFNPVHEYTMNGTYYAQLIVANQFGCRDTTAKIITIARPVSDIRLSSVVLTENAIGTQINIDLINTGNITLDQVMVSWQIGNDAPVLEIISTPLLPGQLINYTFNSILQKSGQQFPYICVGAEISPVNYPEYNLTDNVICKPLNAGGLEVFPPYPNPGDDRMFVRCITPAISELQMRVYDQSGKLCLQFSDTELDSGFHQFFIDISPLLNGSYKLVIQSGSHISSVSFLKLHKE